jgi:hypothetical protein
VDGVGETEGPGVEEPADDAARARSDVPSQPREQPHQALRRVSEQRSPVDGEGRSDQ